MAGEVHLPLETILWNLKRIANDVQTDHQAVAERELRKCGYVVPQNDRNPDGVMKVLTEAVIEAIQKVDLKKVDPENMKNNDSKRLANLLGVDSLYGPKCFLQDVKKDKLFQKAESPRDMAEYLQKSAADKVAENIIQKQFQIKWNTSTGVPTVNTFYQFCDTERTKLFFKYRPRRAHVEVTLYKECRTQSTSLYVQVLRKRKELLCPKVYIKTAKGWKTWDADTEEFADSRHNQFRWIHKSIKSYIEKNADEQRDDFDSLKNSLTKPTLYWAVLEDDDFSSGEKLKLKSISATQVYVGESNHGILGRWTKDRKNHCEMMKKCLDNVCDMTNYNASIMRDDEIQLLHARLALAKVRGERTALFVIKTFGDDVEKVGLKIKCSLHELVQALSSDEDQTKLLPLKEVLEKLISFLDETKVPLDKAAPSPDENEAYMRNAKNYLNEIKNKYLIIAEEYLNNLPNDLNENLLETVNKVKTELNKAKDCINHLQKNLTLSRLQAGKLLENEEKNHLNGKIELVLTGCDNNHSEVSSKIKFEPTDMSYGMNGRR